MPQEIVRQVNFNVGEIDPKTDARSDLKVYYAGLELAENLVTTPVGPIIRRPGTEFIDRARRVLQYIPFTADMLSVEALGGTVADIAGLDADPFVTALAIPSDAVTVLLNVDFGAPQDIGLIDLIDFAAKDPAAPDAPAAPPFVYPYNPPPGGSGGGVGGFGNGAFEP